MSEIKCPHCGQLFSVDESEYASIVNQVKNNEFNKELKLQEERLKKEYEATNKAKELKIITENERKIAELERQIELSNSNTSIKIKDVEIKKNEEILSLKSEISKIKEAKENELSLKEATLKNSYNKIINDLKLEIESLKSEIKNSDNKRDLLIMENTKKNEELLNEKEKEIIKLKNDFEKKNYEIELHEKSIHDEYAIKLKGKDEEIAFYKDLKSKMSTKMLGETLEQHCEISFNQIRMTAFPNAYFEKDNKVSQTGSKGDFIFKESTEDGIEFISIMFEMKNEADTTATKHKNEDFFKELDKDRCEKGCEYAVLVSTLEPDNELYNVGIVDVSYKYPKMYVIRPQMFIPMITLLRNAAIKSIDYKREIEQYKAQNIDISNFEENMNDFKEKFGRNYRIASEKFAKAIEEIDKSIDHLQKIKDSLLGADNNLRLANNKAEELTIKRLTKNSPTVRLMFEENKKDN